MKGILNKWEFPFPSNGKAYPKGNYANVPNGPGAKVSIPFQRESVPKETLLTYDNNPIFKCFNSLPTGKRTQSFMPKLRFKTPVLGSFNSLPTGKRTQSLLYSAPLPMQKDRVSIPFQRESVPKELQALEQELPTESFHSLPTGKRTQRLK